MAWAWQELQGRAAAGQLTKAEAGTLLDGLVPWLHRDYPNGYHEPLNWLGQLLDELDRRKLVPEAQAFQFLVAFYGNPTLAPLKRVREGEQRLHFDCTYGSVWHQDLLGMHLLNELRTTIDDEPIPLPKASAVVGTGGGY